MWWLSGPHEFAEILYSIPALCSLCKTSLHFPFLLQPAGGLPSTFKRGCCSNPTLFLHLLLKFTQNSQGWHRLREERESSECSQLSQNHSLSSSFESCVTWSNFIYLFISFNRFLKGKCEHLGFGCTSICCTPKTLNATCPAKPLYFEVKETCKGF